MTKGALSKTLRKLSISDRVQLIDELWHSVAADQDEIPVTDWQKTMIDKNLAHIEAHPEDAVSHEQFEKQVDLTIARMQKRADKKR